MAAECRSPWAVISPTPSARHAARSRKLNARLENGSPEYPAKTWSEAARTPARSHDAAAFKALLNVLPFEKRRA